LVLSLFIVVYVVEFVYTKEGIYATIYLCMFVVFAHDQFKQNHFI